MNILKKISKIIGILAILFILVATILYFICRHSLDFNPENKDFDKIIIYGDIRSSYVTHNKIAGLIDKEEPQMVLFTGDVASNSHNFLHFLYQTVIEHKVWKDAEYYPTRGNHEDDIFYYDMFFDLPNDKTYYSFDRSGMHFIVLDVIDIFSPVDEIQLQWLKDDLEKNKHKPISVSLHLPLFTSGKYEPYEAPYLIELFEKYNVLFVFCAHVHSYERSLYKGTQYVVTAGGGAPLYPVTRHNPHKVVREQKHHYCILTRNGNEYTLTVKDIDGNIIDTVTTSTEEKAKGISANNTDINIETP